MTQKKNSKGGRIWDMIIMGCRKLQFEGSPSIVRCSWDMAPFGLSLSRRFLRNLSFWTPTPLLVCFGPLDQASSVRFLFPPHFFSFWDNPSSFAGGPRFAKRGNNSNSFEARTSIFSYSLSYRHDVILHHLTPLGITCRSDIKSPEKEKRVRIDFLLFHLI